MTIRGNKRPLRRFGVFAAAISLLALAGIGALVVTEVGYRISGLGQSARRGNIIDVNLFHFSPYVVSAMPPNLRLGNSTHILESRFDKENCVLPDGTTAIFNKDGYRSPEFTSIPPKRPDEIRLIITGGSAAMSWGISEGCTLDRNLKKLLEKALPGTTITVVNLANAGWKSFQEVIAMQLHGIDLEPDIVLSFSGFNDFHHSFYGPVNRAYSAGHMENAFRLYREAQIEGVRDFLSTFTFIDALTDLFRPRALSAPDADRHKNLPLMADRPDPGGMGTKVTLPLDFASLKSRVDFDPHNRRAVDNYLRNQQLLARSLVHGRRTLISALQPSLYTKWPLSIPERKHLLEMYQPDVNFTVQAYLRAREGLRALERTEDNLVFIDLGPVFNGSNDDIFRDNVHFSKEGYMIVARKLAPIIINIVKKRMERKRKRT